MYAPIPTTGLGTLGRNGFGVVGMGAAGTADPNVVSRCKMAYITMAGCDPDISWWDWLTASYNGPECERQKTGYFACLAASLPIPPGAGPAPASAVDPNKQGQVAGDQAASDAGSLDAWIASVQQTLTGAGGSEDPTAANGIPWGWIAAGAAAIVLLRRL